MLRGFRHTGRSLVRSGREAPVACPLRAIRSQGSRRPALNGAAPLPPSSSRPLSTPPQYAPSYVGVVEKVVEAEELLPLPAQESPADDPSLANPLQRMERLSTGWFGVIMVSASADTWISRGFPAADDRQTATGL